MDTDSVKVVEDKVELVDEEKVVTMYSKDQDEKTVVEMILEELIEACIKPARMIMKEPEESRHFDSSDSPKIIDISEDCSDEEEQTEGKEVTDEEVTTTNLVESVIDEILCSVSDQDSDVVSEIIEYIMSCILIDLVSFFFWFRRIFYHVMYQRKSIYSINSTC